MQKGEHFYWLEDTLTKLPKINEMWGEEGYYSGDPSNVEMSRFGSDRSQHNKSIDERKSEGKGKEKDGNLEPGIEVF